VASTACYRDNPTVFNASYYTVEEHYLLGRNFLLVGWLFALFFDPEDGSSTFF
jgi:hypothetical protein